MGRTACHASIARPTAGSTGLVNAVCGLVRRHVEQAHFCLVAVAGVGLPANRTDAQADDLVDAQPSEQPQERDGADELERIPRSDRPVGGEVVDGEVQPGPHQLRPHLIGDHSRVRADQRAERPRQRERPPGVETPLDPFPLLQVGKEAAQRPHVRRLRPWAQRAAGVTAHVGGVRGLRELADDELVDRRDPAGGVFSRPRARVAEFGVFALDPAARLDRHEVGRLAAAAAERRGLKPSLDPPQPQLRHAKPAGVAARKPVLTRRLAGERWRVKDAHVGERA